MHLSSLLTVFGAAWALHVSENTNSTVAVQNIPEDLTVDSGVYYSVSENQLTTVSSGAVLINGAWHTVADNGQSTIIRCLVDLFVNNGIFQFDNLNGGKWSNFYTIATRNFENTGDMYWGFSLEQEDPVVTIVSKGEFANSGMMVFRKDGGALKNVQLLNDGASNTINNNGSICLFNSNCTQKTNILGDGCIYLGEGTNFEVDFTAQNHNFEFDPKQVITMDVSTSFQCLGLGSFSGQGNHRFTISGFGLGNFIMVDFSVDHYHYDADKGELTLYHPHGLSLTFVIGPGYDETQFELSEDKTGFQYNKQPPNISYECRCEKDFPEPHVVPDDTCVCEPNNLFDKIRKAIDLLKDNGYTVTKDE